MAKNVINKYGVKENDIFMMETAYTTTRCKFFQVVGVTEASCRVVEIFPTRVGEEDRETFYALKLGVRHGRKFKSAYVQNQTKGDSKRIVKNGDYIHICLGDNWAFPYNGEQITEKHYDYWD